MPRAIWKGYLKVDELACAISLYTAASTAERVSFHTLNRSTGNRVNRRYIDLETDQAVEREDQVKGYETGKGQYVVLEPEDLVQAVPESDKTLNVETFLACAEIDTIYFDKPYYLAPANAAAADAFVLIREGLRAKNAAALARAVLFRRVRTVLIRPLGEGLTANTLNFDYEVRAAEDAFSAIPDMDIQDEMLELAKHIIKTKTGDFDPASFTDRYDDALAELVKAKSEGRKIEAPKPDKAAKVVDLMEALRQSASAPKSRGKKAAATPAAKSKTGAGRNAAARKAN